MLPTDGETLAIQVGAGRSHGTDASSGFYGRTYGRLTVYRPLGRTWYGQARLELGRVFLRPKKIPKPCQWAALPCFAATPVFTLMDSLFPLLKRWILNGSRKVRA